MKSNINTNKGKSIFLLSIWILFISWSIYFYIKDIKLIYNRCIFVLIWLWLISLIVWWIGLYSLHKKRRIKKNKETMNKITAKIVYFNTQNNSWIKDSLWNKRDNYYFIAAEWDKYFQSEDFKGTLTGWYGNIIDLLKYIDIQYYINSKDQVLEAINNKLDAISKLEKQSHDWKQTLLLINAYNTIKSIKYQLEKPAPYLDIQGNKIFVWDEITIYINPKDTKEYRIDTDSLLTKD